MEVQTRKEKAAQTRLNQEAAGIPDSRPSAAPGGADPILACHINGVLIAELGLEPHVIAVLNRQMTDEGIAERNARPGVREPSGITQGRDGWDKSLEQRRDDVLDRDMDTWQARDPLKEKAEAYTTPGYRPKFMSAARIKSDGSTGDYRVVKYPAGHPQAGDPVMAKGMVLGEMPERRAVARAKHFAGRGAELVKQVEGKHQAEGGTID